MKARAQVAARPARAARAPVRAGRAPARPSALADAAARLSTGRTFDAHERQAHALADRFVAGDRHLGRLASAAPASRLPLPGSVGQPLPGALRADLEAAFGADLGALRIHADASAADAAQALGANAFASGAHLVFNTGRFRPETPRGRHLLAHEVAHALQQAGRRSIGGRLCVVEVDGTAAPQRDAMPDLQTLAKLHAPPARSSRRAAYDELVATIAPLDAKADDGALFKAWAREQVKKMKSLGWSWQAESLLYDLLKRQEEFELAADMIDRDRFGGGPHIETLGFNEAVPLALEKRHDGWDVYAQAITAVPWLQAYEKAWLAAIERFALLDDEDSLSPLPRSDGGGTIAEHVKGLADRINAGRAPTVNEWMYNALLLMFDIDQNRLVTCPKIRTESRTGKHATSQDVALLRVKALSAWGKSLATQASSLQNVLDGRDRGAVVASLSPYLAALGKKVATIANNARIAWQGNRSLESASGVSDHDKALALKELREIAGPLGERTGLPHLLAEMLVELGKGATDEASRLDIQAWRQLGLPWAAKLRALAEGQIKAGTLAAFHSGPPVQLQAWMALGNFALAVARTLEGIASPADAAGPAWIQNREDIAYRRIHLAGAILGVSRGAHWPEPEKAALEIVEARDENDTVLALQRSQDEKDKDSRYFRRDALLVDDLVSEARRDFNGRPIRGIEPFALDTVALFYQTNFYRLLAEQIGRRLPASDEREKEIVEKGLAVPYIAEDAQRATKLLATLPERWRAYGVAFAAKAGSKRTFVEMLRNHPAVQELERKKRPEGFQTVVPDAPGDTKLWFVPPIAAIYEAVHDSPMLKAFVAASFEGGLSEPERLRRESSLSREEWLDRLQRVFAGKMKDPEFVRYKLPGIVAHIFGLVSSDYVGAAAEHRTMLTRPIRVDRQLVARQIAAIFDKYLGNRGIPKPLHDAVHEIGEFNRIIGVFGSRDRRRQLGLLMLEIGEPMRDALGKVDDIAIVEPMLGFALQGMEAVQALSAMKPEDRKLWLPPWENDAEWLRVHKDVLGQTLTHLSDVRMKEQSAQGFLANKETQEVTAYVKLSKPLPVYTLLQPRYNGLLGDPSTRAYRITQIKHSFIYHPAYGDAPLLDKDAPTGHRKAQLLEPNGKPLAVGPTAPLLRIDIIEADGKTVQGHTNWKRVGSKDVTANDEALLADLANGTLWAGFVSAMGTIEAGIEGILNMFLDLVELIPGIGPAVAAARIGAAIAEFLASADFSAIMDTVKGGFVAIVKGVEDALAGRIDSQSVFLLLLFGDPRLDALLANSTIGLGKSSDAPLVDSGSSRFGKLAAVLHAFRRLGHGVAHALREVDHYAERPMQDVRITASTGPLLSFVLLLAADYLYEITEVASHLEKALVGKADSGSGGVDALKKELTQQQEGFGDRIHDALVAIQHFELPREVVDITPLFASVMEFAVSFVMKRTGFIGKIINVVLKDVGVYEYITTEVAKQLIGSDADPNKYWQEKILPSIEGDFNRARNSIVEGINQIFQDEFFHGVVEPVPGVSDIKVGNNARKGFPETAEDFPDIPDAKPQPSADRPLVPRPAQLPAFGEGLPLPATAREHFERGTGQDMGHVRLHTGGVGDAMTSAFGADALTSGSHVFVRSGKLDATLDHELVHVLQQTGPRPLGRRHANTPVRGHPERGLDFRPDSEAEADQVAGALRQGRGGRMPVRGGAGLQPMNLDLFTVRNLLHHVADLNTVMNTGRSVAASQVGGELSVDMGKAVDRIVEILQKPQLKPWNQGKGPFQSVHKQIGERFTNAVYAAELRKAARTVASQAVEPVDQDSSVPHYLEHREFRKHLEAVILARLGILLDIEFHTDAKSHGHGVDLDNPVASVKVRHIHLPAIGGTADLWKMAVHNTWPRSRTDDAYYKRLRRKLRPILQSWGTEVGVWPIFGSDYVFGKPLTRAVNEAIDKVDADPVAWTDYIQTEGGTRGIGLRLSTYEQDTQQARKDRESHHLVQYLVGQFFANENDKKAFDQPRAYPGVVPATGPANTPLKGREVSLIMPTAQGSSGIQVARTSGKGRGGEMPTISLAATTHQRGKLHITPEADERPGEKSRSTQAGMLVNFFRDQLPKEVIAEPKRDDTNTFTEGRGKDTSRFPGPDGTFDHWVSDTGADKVAEKIHDAVQATYKKVEADMSRQLADNMPGLEYQYFIALVEDSAHDIGPRADAPETEQQKLFMEALAKIPALAKAHNAKGLIPLGWKATP